MICRTRGSPREEAAREGEARPKDSEVSSDHTTECNDFTWNTLPYYITACISQSLLSLCLSMSACCKLLFKKRYTLSDPYSLFTVFTPHSFLFVRCARKLNAERKQQDARCVLQMACATTARTTPKTRCRIPPGDSLSWRCPVPSIIGLAYIQRHRPDSSTAQTCHSALWAHAFQTKACILHFSMYFARVSLSLSLHVFVLPVSCSRMSRHFVYVFYTLSGMHSYQDSYPSFTPKHNAS